MVVEYPWVLMQKHISFYVLREHKDSAERVRKAEHLLPVPEAGFWIWQRYGLVWWQNYHISEVIKLRTLLCPIGSLDSGQQIPRHQG